MSGVLSLGTFGVFIALHIILALLTVAIAGVSPSECATTMPDWSCMTPLRGLAEQYADGASANLLDLVLGTVSGIFQLLLGFLILDYDILKGQDSITGSIGFVIRAFGWAAVLAGTISASIGLFFRR